MVKQAPLSLMSDFEKKCSDRFCTSRKKFTRQREAGTVVCKQKKMTFSSLYRTFDRRRTYAVLFSNDPDFLDVVWFYQILIRFWFELHSEPRARQRRIRKARRRNSIWFQRPHEDLWSHTHPHFLLRGTRRNIRERSRSSGRRGICQILRTIIG